MKKQTNLSRPHAGKLSLNKKTISNLTAAEMSNKIGGTGTGYTRHHCHTEWCTFYDPCKGHTYNKPCRY